MALFLTIGNIKNLALKNGYKCFSNNDKSLQHWEQPPDHGFLEHQSIFVTPNFRDSDLTKVPYTGALGSEPRCFFPKLGYVNGDHGAQTFTPTLQTIRTPTNKYIPPQQHGTASTYLSGKLKPGHRPRFPFQVSADFRLKTGSQVLI